MRIKSYPLPHFNERPEGTEIDTIVIHSMYAKEHLKKTYALNCFKILDQNKVSAHYSIDRYGCVWQHVGDRLRAWHAGESRLPLSGSEKLPRENVNDFSIGIEMIGVWGQRFKASQYRALNSLLTELLEKYPVSRIVSHQAIASARKIDPGPAFRWDKLKRMLRRICRKGIFPEVTAY